MISFSNIKSYSTDFPKTGSFLWSEEDAAQIPQTHKDQICFLNKEASLFVENYLNGSKMLTGPVWKPFNERYFKTVEAVEVTEEFQEGIKKWLYKKPIPFDKWVYLHGDRSGQAVTLTWKMVIKYWDGLFWADDLILFDETLNWGLFYFHEDVLFYGYEKCFDKAYEYEKTLELNELKSRYFDRNNLNFTKEEKRNAINAFKEKYQTDRLE